MDLWTPNPTKRGHLKEIDLLPNYCLIGEPTCEEIFGDAIKVGRRGS